MEKQPEIQKLTSESLLAFAEGKEPGNPEVREMLLKWIEFTQVPEDAGAESVEYLKVAIMHSFMKYRLGFLTKDEVLEELEETRQGVVADVGPTSQLHQEISDLMYGIEDELDKLDDIDLK